MKITANRTKLLAAMNAVAPAVARNDNKPILKSVKHQGNEENVSA